METDFIPDFTFKNIFGLLVSKNSKIKQNGQFSFINVQNKVIQINTLNKEIMETFGSIKTSQITAFNINESFLILGYENGVVIIIARDGSYKNLYKLHHKKINSIEIYQDLFISSSSDGSFCVFDTVLFSESFYTTEAVIFKTYCGQDVFISSCGDKSIRFFDKSSKRLIDMVVFDEFIFDFMLRGNEFLVIFDTGKSVIYNLNSKEQKQFYSYKKPKDVFILENFLVIHCWRKVHIYKLGKENLTGLVNERICNLDENTKSVSLLNENLVC